MSSPWIRRAAWALAALAALLLAAGAVFVASFDANRYKALAIDWMATERQRTLAIDGSIDLALWPRLALKVSGLHLSESGEQRGTEFAALDEASLSVRLWPLLRGQLVVDRIGLKGLRARLTRNADGVRNTDDLLTGKDTGKDSRPPGDEAGAGTSALRFDISAIELADLQLSLRDELAKLVGEIRLKSLTAGRLAQGVATPLSLQAELELSQPQPLKLALAGQARLTPDIDQGALALDGLALSVRGDAAGLRDLAVALEGALAWDGKTLRGTALRLRVERAALATTVLAPSTLALKSLVYSPGEQRLALEALTLALDWPRLAVADRQVLGSPVSGRFKLGGASPLAGSLQSAAPGGSLDALSLPGLVLTLAGRVGTQAFEGTLKTDLLLQPASQVVALEPLVLVASLTAADSTATTPPPVLPIELRGKAQADPRRAEWSLEGTLDGHALASQGSADLGGAVPRLVASARFDQLDLNALTHPGKPAPAAAAPGETTVQLGGLRAVDGRFELQAGALAFRQYRVADASLAATLDGGLLRITRLSGRAWGGRIEASGSAGAGGSADGQALAVKLKASGVDVQALLKDVAGKDLLEGRGQVSADVTTSGASLGALRSKLAGTAALQLRDGAIKGINLARSMRQAKAALSQKQDAITQAQATEKTDFSELSASARIVGGVAHSDDLVVKSPYLRIGGDGRFDIGRGRIDYTAHATVVNSGAGQGARELAALSGVTVPVQLSGPFDAIDWKIQWSGVAAAAIENKLKARLAAELGIAAPADGAASSPPKQPRDLLRDKLRGLFR